MTLADLSIKRPTFIACVVLLMLSVGYYAMQSLGVDLFPDVTFPVVFVSTPYQGAGPAEIETLVTKPIEDELSTLPGIKRLTSVSQEGVSSVIAEFTLETDIKFAEQEVRDRVGSAKRTLPKEIDEPIIRRLDPADQPLVILSIKSKEKLTSAELFDVADQVIRPRLEQVDQVGQVYALGARKRMIKVSMDAQKLKLHELSMGMINSRLQTVGENIPAGKLEDASHESTVRTLGQFTSLASIGDTIINFFGSEHPLRVKDIATVEDSLVDETSRVYINGVPSLFIYVFKQSGANTIQVVDKVLERVRTLGPELQKIKGSPEVEVVRDGSIYVRANVTDVKESIFTGILLAVLVVFFFLGNGRSTIITALALPNSLLGAFVLMWAAGYTINLMSLLALSLSVGLLIDDAIVVRENIYRHIEMGFSPRQAAIDGTKEVTMAVIATTLTVIAVFGPVAFLKGVVGQFFKQFGFVVCFAMLISLFDALTIAPMLSAYFAGRRNELGSSKNIFSRMVDPMLIQFEKFQTWLEHSYEALLHKVLARPAVALSIAFGIFLLAMSTIVFVPKTFLPAQDAGEFSVDYDLPPGTSLGATDELGLKLNTILRNNPEVDLAALTVGNSDGEANVGSFYVKLVPAKNRKMNTSQVKEKIREELKPYAYAAPKVKDFDPVSSGQRPFNLNIIGTDEEQLTEYTNKVFSWLKTHPGLKDVDVNYRPGKPEVQLALKEPVATNLGISSSSLGQEMRALIEGFNVAKYRENGREYDVRTRLVDSERNVNDNYDRYFVPNLNGNLIKLSDVADKIERAGPSKINRQDRARYIQIQADIAPGGGMGDVIKDIEHRFQTDLPLPTGMRYAFVGQAENFKELGDSMVTAMVFGVLFIFLVLASLYESFVTPFSIMMALPLAFCGSIVALAITRASLDIFSMIGVIMLLGVAVKNSILLVDYANQLIQEGKSRTEAMIQAGRTRLRPILMTSFALIAGTIPIAIGLNEASRQRTSMGIAIIGGLVSSTLLTLVVVPASFSFVDRFRIWSKTKLGNLVRAEPGN